MGKTVYKRRFLDIWRIGETESWLSDMAANGLRLTSLGTMFARFERGEPDNIRYRIDFTHSEDRSAEEQLELYADSGWEYVCELGEYRIFRSPEELDAPEIHTDPAEQAFTLQRLHKMVRRNTLVVNLFMAAALAMLFFAVFFGKTPLLTFVEGEQITLPIVAVLIIYSLFSQIGELVSAGKLMRSLREGRPINHRAGWKKLLNSRRIVMGIIGVFALIIVVLPFTRIAMSRNEELPLVKNNQLHLRLSDIETDPALERKPMLRMEGIDWGNFTALKWSPYAPMMITLQEYGVVPGRMWPDGSGEYSPSIGVELYRLRFEWLADGVVKDLCSKYSGYDLAPVSEQTGQEGFDRLFIRSADSFREVFASRKNAVIHVRYYGEEDMDAVIEAVRAVLEGM